MSENEWLDIFSKNLIEMMDKYKYTQKLLADETGLQQSTISRYIHKQQIPKISALISIADVLGCTLDELAYFGDRIDL